MELLTISRRDNAIAEVKPKPKAQYHDELIMRYGSPTQMSAFWANNLFETYAHIERFNDNDTLARFRRVYSDDVMVATLSVVAMEFFKAMKNKDLTYQDAKEIAQGIVFHEQYPLLSMARVVRFFTEIANGNYNCYNGTRPHVMRALKEYYPIAKRKQELRLEEEEKRKPKPLMLEEEKPTPEQVKEYVRQLYAGFGIEKDEL